MNYGLRIIVIIVLSIIRVSIVNCADDNEVVDLTPIYSEEMVKNAFSEVKVIKGIDGILIEYGNGISLVVANNCNIHVLRRGLPEKRLLNILSPIISKLSSIYFQRPIYVPDRTSIQKVNISPPKNPISLSYSLNNVKILSDRIRLTFITTSSGSDGIKVLIDLVPASFRVSGEQWQGFGVSYQIIGGMDLTYLEVKTNCVGGGTQRDFKTWGHTPYGKARGFKEYDFKDRNLDQALKLNNIFYASQPFQLLATKSGSHLSFAEASSVCDAEIALAQEGYSINYLYHLGIIHSSTTVPFQYHLFMDRKCDKSDYVTIAYSLIGYLRRVAGMSLQDGAPIAGASRDNQIKLVTDWSKYADKVIPVAKRLGFKRIWAGFIPTKKHQRNFEYTDREVNFQELKSFCDKAHSASMEVVIWLETCTTSLFSEIVRKHPEWVSINPNSSAPHYADLKDILIINPSRFYLDWLLNNIKELRASTGLDGVWMDSFEFSTRILSYADKEPKYGEPLMLDFLRRLEGMGVRVYGEAASPYLNSSFWVRKDRYASYNGNEYGLVGTSPYTNRPDSDYVDYFKSVSYKSFPIFDIHPFIDNVLIYYKQKEIEDLVAKTNKAVSSISKELGSQTELHVFSHGTYWSSPKGIAIFVHKDIKSLVIHVRKKPAVKVIGCKPGQKEPSSQFLSPDKLEIGNISDHMAVIVSYGVS